MDQLIWVLIIIFLIVIGIILFFLEFETEEIEFFGLISIILLVLGAIIWFTINSKRIIVSKEIFLFISIVIVTIPFTIILFTIFLIKKIKDVIESPPAVNSILVGKKAICTETINNGSTGYIRYKSELWKAKAMKPIMRGQKVYINAQDNLIVFVEAIGSSNISHCPNCGQNMNPDSDYCADCGSKL